MVYDLAMRNMRQNAHNASMTKRKIPQLSSKARWALKRLLVDGLFSTEGMTKKIHDELYAAGILLNSQQVRYEPKYYWLDDKDEEKVRRLLDHE